MRTLFFVAFCSPALLFSQRFNKYWIEFTDKNDSPFSLHRPAEFLSARALERRETAGIALDETDLPVNPNYLNPLKINGLTLHGASRWINGAAVIADSNAIKSVKNLPFIRSIKYVGPHISFKNPPSRRARRWNPGAEKIPGRGGYFGHAEDQLSLTGEVFLHGIGATGQGKMVVVMDGGFINVDTLPFFDSLFTKNTIFQGPDFVERDGCTFESASHGTAVLSVMAADLPGFFMGAAPEATYYCVKTEDTGGEFPIEEVNWVLGAEWADSLGADVLNASLGYTTFNDNSLTHSYLELDGRTSIAARGAAIGAKKGMIICNSAGNEGDGDWHFIGTPADAPGVIAVGAVRLDGQKAGFSSFGPTADGRIKPDLATPGEAVVAASIRGHELSRQNGTSLASPLLAGSLAALWSAFPEKTGAEILDAVFQTASQNAAPDNELGWGIPDFFAAWMLLSGQDFNLASGRDFCAKATGGDLNFIRLGRVSGAENELEIRDCLGRFISKKAVGWSPEIFPTARIFGAIDGQAGIYFLRAIDGENVLNSFIVK